MEDIAAITGGTPIFKATGSTTTSVKASHFGSARRIWADRDFLGIVGGHGDTIRLRKHLTMLKQAHQKAKTTQIREATYKRIGRMLNGSVMLYVGGFTDTETTRRKDVARRTATALRMAQKDGVLLGGGVALLQCRAVLEDKLQVSKSADERAAYRILLEAIEAPFRALVDNAGDESGGVLAMLDNLGDSYGYDVISREVRNFAEAGLWDIATAQKTALRYAISSAALALTIDAVVHHKQPELALRPA